MIATPELRKEASMARTRMVSEKVTADRRMAELKFRPARFKTEVDKRRGFEFILDRGGELQAAVPGLS